MCHLPPPQADGACMLRYFGAGPCVALPGQLGAASWCLPRLSRASAWDGSGDANVLVTVTLLQVVVERGRVIALHLTSG